MIQFDKELTLSDHKSNRELIVLTINTYNGLSISDTMFINLSRDNLSYICRAIEQRGSEWEPDRLSPAVIYVDRT